jgi:hypothetical protein
LTAAELPKVKTQLKQNGYSRSKETIKIIQKDFGILGFGILGFEIFWDLRLNVLTFS